MLSKNPNEPLIVYLQSLAGRCVHFFPKSGNAGDGFITYATYYLFKKFNIDFISHTQEETVTGELVLIGGGGNLIEGRYNDVAELINRHIQSNKVVLLPHTVVGFSNILKETYGNLTIFCREPVSYQMALLNGASPDQTFLSHDLTFFLEDDHFKNRFQPGSGVLHALRTDGESTGNHPLHSSNLDLSLSWNGDLWKDPSFCELVTHSMAAFISPYKTVHTDRLHISILSAFLQKDVFLMPNAYYKNRAIFEHSIRPRFPNVHFVNTAAQLDGAEALKCSQACTTRSALETCPNNDSVRASEALERAEMLRVDVENLNQKMLMIEDSSRKLNEELAVVKIERDKLIEELSAAQSEQMKLKDELSVAQSEKLNLREELSLGEKEKFRIKEEISLLENEKNFLNQRLIDVNAEKVKIEGKELDLQKINSELIESVSYLDAALERQIALKEKAARHAQIIEDKYKEIELNLDKYNEMEIKLDRFAEMERVAEKERETLLELRKEFSILQNEIRIASTQKEELISKICLMENSISWNLTKPLRSFAGVLPESVRKILRNIFFKAIG